MSYKSSRWTKVVFGTVAVGLLAAVFGSPFWHPFKERYFNYVAASCEDRHNLQIAWQDVPAFDGLVEWFVARSEEDEAVLDCINRWAGLIITDHISSDVSNPRIEFSVGGGHYAPPQRLIHYAYMRPAR